MNDPATSSLENAAACAAGVAASNAAVDEANAAASGAAFHGARRGVPLVAAGGGGADGARVADTDVGVKAMAPACSPYSLPTSAALSATQARAAAATAVSMAETFLAHFPFVWQGDDAIGRRPSDCLVIGVHKLMPVRRISLVILGPVYRLFFFSRAVKL